MKDTSQRYPTLGFRLPKEEKDALFARAKAEGVSPSALLRRIIRKLVLSPPTANANTT